VSLINKMLQELDRRHARAAPPGQAVHPEVRVVRAAHGGQEWFWRIVAGLMLIAAAWTLWVVYQLQPRAVATELAYRAAENSRRRVAAIAPPSPSQGAAAPVATGENAPALSSAIAAAKPVPEKLAAPMEMLRLALTIDTPLAPRQSRRAQSGQRKSSGIAPRKQAAASGTSLSSVHIEKRSRQGAPAARAEALFRRAAAQLEQGRVEDAEALLRAALDADHTHQPARQTLIALDIEQGRIDDARRHLQEGLAVNPSVIPYAVALARIYVDRGDYLLALEVLDAVNVEHLESPDFHSMRGAVLLRMERHEEAADSYRRALGAGAQSGASWIGLGISLDALGRGPEAAEAFRRGVATGTLADDLRAYAEQRVRQLQ
jgi:MSHA biogenesis protein MshN